MATQKGINLWSRCSLSNSERDVHRVTKKQKTTLDVPISHVTIEDVKVPWISPRDWLIWIIRKGLWPRLAGAPLHQHAVAGEIWSNFWTEYEKICPDFELFSLPDIDRSKTAAFMIHGDEGRTLKRHGLMVTSIQSCLGLGFDTKHLRRRDDGRWHMKVNYKGHSFTHRFVTSTMPKTVYESNPAFFHKMMDKLALSLRSLLLEGVVDPLTGDTLRVAIIAVKGDAPYLAKMGKFYRSYNTTVKRGSAQSVPKGVCHRCLAGTPGFLAEEIATNLPKWLQTQGIRVPWLSTPSVIQHLVHSRADPSTFFQTDIWHVVHLGFGRSWIASVVHLLLHVINQPNLDAKWSFLTEDYRTWCRRNKKQMHISAITPYLMSYGDKTGTMGQFHKGALTTNLMLWLAEIIGKLPCDTRRLLPECQEATCCMNNLFECLIRADAFLSKEECIYVSAKGLRFLQVYSKMARAQFQEGCPWNFPLYPKLHAYHETILQVQHDGQRVGMAINPLMFSCQVDEDTVGRTSRLSRRVNIRLVMTRTLQRYLMSAHSAFVRAGLLL